MSVNVQTVQPRKLAAVQRLVAPGEVGSAWGPAVGQVWDVCDFGVEVTRIFETTGEVYATETPGGEAAVAVHRGPYDRMHEAYDAIGKWMATNQRESAGQSWEIYGDPTPDPAHTETTVVHLLKQMSAEGPSSGERATRITVPDGQRC